MDQQTTAEQMADDTARGSALRQALIDCAAGRETGLDVIVQTEGRQLLGGRASDAAPP